MHIRTYARSLLWLYVCMFSPIAVPRVVAWAFKPTSINHSKVDCCVKFVPVDPAHSALTHVHWKVLGDAEGLWQAVLLWTLCLGVSPRLSARVATDSSPKPYSLEILLLVSPLKA